MKFDLKKINFLKKDSEPDSSGKKKLSLQKKILICLGAVVCVIVILLASVYGVFLHYYNKMNITSIDDNYDIVTAIDYEEGDIKEDELTDEERQKLDELVEGNGDYTAMDVEGRNVTNILLLGTDSRKKGNVRSRTDSMVILSIDKETNRIIMTSVMRDTYVSIPKVGKNRLNAAFVFGGPKLLFDTIEYNFGIHLDKYVQIDFFNFVDMVNAVGGVDIDLTTEEIKVINKSYLPSINKSVGKKKSGKYIDPKKPGLHHLNGAQALAYSRIRYVGNADFGRTERQRKVLTEIIKKARKMSVSELNQFADVVLPLVSTNLSQSEVMGLLLNAKEYLDYEIVSGRMPIDGSYKYLTIRGASVLGVDFSPNSQYWYELVYGKK